MERKKSKLLKQALTKNFHLKLVAKAFLIFYLIIFSMNYLLSGTNAYFASKGELGFSLKTGQWLFPNLAFDEEENRIVQSCPITVTVPVVNNGDESLSDGADFEIYYSATESPEKGEVIQEHHISDLAADDRSEITFEADRSGYYAIHGSYMRGEERKELWGETIEVLCQASPTLNTDNMNRQDSEVSDIDADRSAGNVNVEGNDEDIEIEEKEEVTTADENKNEIESEKGAPSEEEAPEENNVTSEENEDDGETGNN